MMNNQNKKADIKIEGPRNITEPPFSEDEIRSIIGESALAKIFAENDHPRFEVYCIATETDTAKTDSGSILRYGKKIIEQIFDRIKPNTPVYHTHNPEPDGKRLQVGEIVGKWTGLDEHTEKNVTVAVVYRYPQYDNMSLNIASIESSIVRDENEKVSEIRDVSALALSSTEYGDSPGFEHAKLIEQCCYLKPKKEEDFIMELKLDDVKQWIRENEVKVSEIFDVEKEILADSTVDAIVKHKLKEKHEHARRVSEKLGKTEEELKQYKNKIWCYRGETMLAKKLESLEDSEKVKDYIKNSVSEHISNINIDFSKEEELEEFIDEKVNETYSELEKYKSILGLSEAPQNDEDDGEEVEVEEEEVEEKKEDEPKKKQIIPNKKKNYPPPKKKGKNNFTLDPIDREAEELLVGNQ